MLYFFALSKQKIIQFISDRFYNQIGISGYDFSDDNRVDWKEFKKAFKEIG